LKSFDLLKRSIRYIWQQTQAEMMIFWLLERIKHTNSPFRHIQAESTSQSGVRRQRRERYDMTAYDLSTLYTQTMESDSARFWTVDARSGGARGHLWCRARAPHSCLHGICHSIFSWIQLQI